MIKHPQGKTSNIQMGEVSKPHNVPDCSAGYLHLKLARIFVYGHLVQG